MRIIFMGTPTFGVPTLNLLHQQGHTLLVVCQPSKPVGRKRVLTPPPIAQRALELNLPLYQPEKISTLYETLKAFDPELIVTAAYGQYVPTKILALPSIDAINLHGSLLPKYRGGAPIQRAIMDGETTTGISIMRMVKTLDGGPVFLKHEVPITAEDTSETLFEKLSNLAPVALMDAWEQIVTKTPPVPQDDTQATFAPNLTREEEVLQFTQPNTHVDAHIRAFYPSPATYTTFEGKRLKVFKAIPLETAHSATPGTIIKLHDQGPVVACKTGALVLCDLQLEGKKRLLGEDFLKGIDASRLLGAKFGA